MVQISNIVSIQEATTPSSRRFPINTGTTTLHSVKWASCIYESPILQRFLSPLWNLRSWNFNVNACFYEALALTECSANFISFSQNENTTFFFSSVSVSLSFSAGKGWSEFLIIKRGEFIFLAVSPRRQKSVDKTFSLLCPVQLQTSRTW